MEINQILEIAIPIITALAVWFGKDKLLTSLNIKEGETNIEGTKLANVQKALDLWQEMLDDAVKRHKVQVLELERLIEKIKKDYAELEQISEERDRIIKEQKILIVKQSKSIQYYKNKYEKE